MTSPGSGRGLKFPPTMYFTDVMAVLWEKQAGSFHRREKMSCKRLKGTYFKLYTKHHCLDQLKNTWVQSHGIFLDEALWDFQVERHREGILCSWSKWSSAMEVRGHTACLGKDRPTRQEHGTGFPGAEELEKVGWLLKARCLAGQVVDFRPCPIGLWLALPASQSSWSRPPSPLNPAGTQRSLVDFSFQVAHGSLPALPSSLLVP